MQNSIDAVKNNIQSIHDKLVAEFKTCDQVFAFVRYTDFDQPKDSRTTSLNFTRWVAISGSLFTLLYCTHEFAAISRDPGKFAMFVSAIEACGGGDYAEDVMGGLKVALLELAWRPKACKVTTP